MYSIKKITQDDSLQLWNSATLFKENITNVSQLNTEKITCIQTWCQINYIGKIKIKNTHGEYHFRNTNNQ